MNRIGLYTFMLMFVCHAYAQHSWLKTDTVTSGDFDDFNPQVDHVGMATPNPYISVLEEWVIFERWNNGASSIAAVKFLGDKLKWDDSVAIISPSIAGVVQKYPDICTDQKLISVAAWQERTDSVCNIYYSICDSKLLGGVWSTPTALTNDTVSNTNVKVRALSDSSFILLWRRGSSILFSIFQANQFSQTQTLVVSNIDSTEYDFSDRFVWTRLGPVGNRFCLVSRVQGLNPFVLSPPDTITGNGDMSDPRFISNQSQGSQMFTFDLKHNGKYEPWKATDINAWTVEEFPVDTNYSNLRAVGYEPAQLTATSNQLHLGNTPQFLGYGFYAWERWTGTDTSIVFLGYSANDSTESGSSPSISSLSFFLSDGTYHSFVVWESNRTGRSHIYGRNFSWRLTGIDERSPSASSFKLSQNYPNPFNPQTIITYSIPVSESVSLKVFDALGREIRTLVNERQTPGTHLVTFDGGNLPSGLYFYRLQAGSYSATRKLVLLK